MIGAGFDADGAVETVTRSRLPDSYRVRWARENIREAAWKGVTLGAVSGFGGALLCLVLVWKFMDDRQRGRAAY